MHIQLAAATMTQWQTLSDREDSVLYTEPTSYDAQEPLYVRPELVRGDQTAESTASNTDTEEGIPRHMQLGNGSFNKGQLMFTLGWPLT